MKTITSIILTILLIFTYSCKQGNNENAVKKDPLPSWNETVTKQNIIKYVNDVTKEGDHFIPISDRIATFDNDGNLWSEQPLYFQLFFAMDRIKELAPLHPEWHKNELIQAVLDNDMEKVMIRGTHGLLELVMYSHAGTTTEEFEKIVKNWLKTAKHPKFNKPYNHLIYQPMVELLEYLRANDFTTFIVSGGGIEFMRPWVEDAYGIPPHQVIGSSIKTEFAYNNGNPVIKRLAEIDFIDDKAGKPIGIHKFIGKKPVFASGNSDGDLQMLQWTDSNSYTSFQLYLHHTDSIREWAYDRNSHIGKLDKGLDEAVEKGWTVIDMEKDWKTVYKGD